MRSQRLRHPARLAGASLLRMQSDDRLAELALDGHEAAFAAIVDRYRTPLLRYCAGIVGADRAEDAVQQTLISAHDALTRSTDVRHLRSWLYRIAHNTSLNVLRAVRDDVPLDPAEAASADAGPAAAYERRERLRATLDAVRELPERQRAALVLRELEGRSHEEIADALGVTKGSARQHLMRARTAVRGAVTAVTPYPLLARLADGLWSPGAPGLADAAVGAGVSATLAKVTAGVVATGAIVGGAVGTQQVVGGHRGGIDPPAAQAAPASAHPASGASSTPAALGAAQPTAVQRAKRGSGATSKSAKDRHAGARGHSGADDDHSGPGGAGSAGASGGSGDPGSGRDEQASSGRRDGNGRGRGKRKGGHRGHGRGADHSGSAKHEGRQKGSSGAGDATSAAGSGRDKGAAGDDAAPTAATTTSGGEDATATGSSGTSGSGDTTATTTDGSTSSGTSTAAAPESADD